MDFPLHFNFSIHEHKFMKDIYEALDDDDTSAVVITALQILRTHQAVPQIKRESKSEESSQHFRNKGNDYLRLQKYQEAMEYYNRALMYAPNNSRAMKLAYGNRSYIFFKNNKFIACIKDVKMSLAIPTATDIDVKLKVRLEDATKYKDVEEMMILHSFYNAANGPSFFKVEKPNPDIPCASSDVGVVRERRGPKLVAKNDVKVGTVLAIEEAFSLDMHSDNKLSSCYYCSKKSLNLIPCDGCCCVLYCDSKCQRSSLNEGHNIECQVMEIINALSIGVTYKLILALKTALKIRQKCKNWREFIDASHCVGLDRSRKSTIKEMYDVNEKFSLLCFNEDRLFIHGAMVNVCFAIATMLHYLETVKNYLPEDEREKKEAMRALARVIMVLNVYTITKPMYQPVTIVNPNVTKIITSENITCFSFLGKLRHSCVPNVLPITLNKKMVLVACRPIKAGTPLTVHYVGAHVRSGVSMNTSDLFISLGIVCSCVVCVGKNKSRIIEHLNEETKQKLRELNFLRITRCNSKTEIPKIYPTLCEIMTVLEDVPHSMEYEIATEAMVKCLISFADYECRNILLDRSHIKTIRQN